MQGNRVTLFSHAFPCHYFCFIIPELLSNSATVSLENVITRKPLSDLVKNLVTSFSSLIRNSPSTTRNALASRTATREVSKCLGVKDSYEGSE